MTSPHRLQQPESPYTSPIPVRRAHLGDALASEWTKIRSVRSTLWTLGVMAVLMIGFGVFAAAVIVVYGADLGGEPVLGLGFFGVLLSLVCVISLGVLTISSEYGTGMIRTTLTACPSRARVLAAKSVVLFLLVLVFTTVATTLVAMIQTAMIGTDTSTGEDWFRATVGIGLYMALLGVLSLAVGALLRHTAASITLMIGLVLMPLVLAMFMATESLGGLRDALFEYSIPSQISVFYGAGAESGPSGWEPLWIMLGVTAVALAGAFLSLDRRDA